MPSGRDSFRRNRVAPVGGSILARFVGPGFDSRSTADRSWFAASSGASNFVSPVDNARVSFVFTKRRIDFEPLTARLSRVLNTKPVATHKSKRPALSRGSFFGFFAG